MEKGGIPVDDFIKYLNHDTKTFEEEMDEIFDYFDYDKKDELSKHKLKIIASELSKYLPYLDLKISSNSLKTALNRYLRSFLGFWGHSKFIDFFVY